MSKIILLIWYYVEKRGEDCSGVTEEIILHLKLLSQICGRISWKQLNEICFFAEGFKESAEKFKDEAGINTNVELSGMDSRIKIRDAIQAGKVTEATSMVHQLYPELLDDDRYLFFHLQVSF